MQEYYGSFNTAKHTPGFIQVEVATLIEMSIVRVIQLSLLHDIALRHCKAFGKLVLHFNMQKENSTARIEYVMQLTSRLACTVRCWYARVIQNPETVYVSYTFIQDGMLVPIIS